MFNSDGKKDLSNNNNNSAKYEIKLRLLSDLKWLNYLFIEFVVFQLIFFGMFSLFSLIIVPLQFIIFFRLHSILRKFPLYEDSEIDYLSSETKKLENISQFAVLLNILDFVFFYFELIWPIGIRKFNSFDLKQRFNLIILIITGLKVMVIYLMKMKIQRLNIRSAIINL